MTRQAQVGSNVRGRVQIIFFALFLAAGIGFILASDLLVAPRTMIQKGQAAGEDIIAPSRIEFVSEIRTKAEKQRAAAAVADVYDPLDRQAGREQVSLALQVLSFIDSVRADPYASPEDRRFALESILTVQLSPQVISDTLALDETQWKTVQLETRQVLDEIMKREIRSGQEDVRRREVRTLIDFELSEAQTAIVDEIVSALVKANRIYNAEKTDLARQSAVDTVKPVIRTLEVNQVIVRSGDVVDDEDLEALAALGLNAPSQNWFAAGSAVLIALIFAVAVSVYLFNAEPQVRDTPRHLLLLLLLLLLFVFIAKWGVGLTNFQPYLVPLGAVGMLATAILNVRVGLVVHLVVCLTVGYLAQGRIDLFWYYLLGGLVGLFAMRRVRRINTFVLAGGCVMTANVVTIATFALLEGKFDSLWLTQLGMSGMINGALTATLTLGGYYLLGVTFQITTSLQLMDLARPTHPLLRDLLLKAPGSYHHSIIVGNMAEQAAEAIGADALLARVGAFYHDIGKTMRPYFFTENQMDGSNPHDLLDPETSVQIIRSHTVEGLELAKKYHLPKALQAFISEHHGTSTISYFYHKATKELGADNVREEDYRHVGMRPQSKETAIVMMADTCEAAVRSIHPHDAVELEALIRKLIAAKISSGQLDHAPLTLQEIELVTRSFVDTLQGVFHPRIQYPGQEKKEEAPSRQLTAGEMPESGQEDRAEGSTEEPGVAAEGSNEIESDVIWVKEGQDDSSADSPAV
ncbi:MAG: HDIG domain-containing protein [Anaerolineae bacterium]|nr:HDIG domain-containing protein [Anaerolineae bacterium]